MLVDLNACPVLFLKPTDGSHRFLYNSALANSFDSSLSYLLSPCLLLPGQGTEDSQLLSLLGYRGVAGASYISCKWLS